MRMLQRFIGRGQVSKEDGTVIGDRDYDLTVWQKMRPAKNEEVPGFESVRGTIAFKDEEIFALVGKHLQLSLEDGEKFKFFVQSTDGNIAAMGGIEQGRSPAC